jgi:hypothetical protein
MYDCLGCTLSYKREKDVANKLTKFLQITGIISQAVRPSESRSKPNYEYKTK